MNKPETQRWIYASTPVELEHRKQITKKIDKFWLSFKKNADMFKNPPEDLNIIANWATSELGKINPDLVFEFSEDDAGTILFVITQEGKFDLHPLIETMIDRAPSISGFRFGPYREAMPLKYVPACVEARTGYWPTDLRVSFSRSEKNALNLTFYSSEFEGSRNENIDYCVVVCEVLLGQEVFEQWIDRLKVVSRSRKKKRSKSQSKKKTKVPKDAINVLDARDKILKLHKSILKSPSKKPLWQTDNLYKSLGGAILIGGKAYTEKGGNRMTFRSATPHVLIGAQVPPTCFSSRRFSRCSETFCYIKIDESFSKIKENSPEHTELEEKFDKALRKAKLGCVTGGGKGSRYTFIDLALTDLAAAIPIVRQVASKQKLPKQSWLLFLDSKLSAEWVGLAEDSPAPEELSDW